MTVSFDFQGRSELKPDMMLGADGAHVADDFSDLGEVGFECEGKDRNSGGLGKFDTYGIKMLWINDIAAG